MDMKNTTISITINTEQLNALTYYMVKKELNLQDDLNDYIQKLYERHVPQATREYLDDKIARESTSRPMRPRRAQDSTTVEVEV